MLTPARRCPCRNCHVPPEIKGFPEEGDDNNAGKDIVKPCTGKKATRQVLTWIKKNHDCIIDFIRSSNCGD